MRGLWLGFAAFVLTAQGAWADEAPNCGLVFTEECAKASLAEADKNLNGVYADAMSCLIPEQQNLLKTAQRAWWNFREAQAQFSGATPWAERGTYTMAMDMMTRTRIDEVGAIARDCHKSNPNQKPLPPVP